MAKYFLRLGDREIEADLEETPAGLRVNIDGVWHDVRLRRLARSPRYVLTLQNRLLEVLVGEEAGGFAVQIRGNSYDIETVRRRRRGANEYDYFEAGKWVLVAPLTGVVVEVRVAVGDTVEQGDVLLVVEAMKMLNELRSRVAGEVTGVHVSEKERVEIGTRLLEISAAEPPEPQK